MSRIFLASQSRFFDWWRASSDQEKTTPQDGFGHAFGNEDFELLQTLVKPINLAEEVSNNPYVGFRQIYIGLWTDGHPKLP